MRHNFKIESVLFRLFQRFQSLDDNHSGARLVGPIGFNSVAHISVFPVVEVNEELFFTIGENRRVICLFLLSKTIFRDETIQTGRIYESRYAV